MKQIEVVGHCDAAPAAVFALLADVGTWSSWGAWESAGLETADEHGGGGVGAVRRLTSRAFGRTVVSRERVLEVTPDRRIRYGLLSGLPLLDYVGTVDLAAEGSGTAITWSSRFRPRVPGTGWFYALVLRRFLADTVAALSRAAVASRPAA